MSQESIAVPLRILDKEYRVSCTSEEEAGLYESAQLLDQRMRELRKTGRVVGADRIAVMAALNIIYELIKLQSSRTQSEQELERRLGDLQRRLDAALAAQQRMDRPDESV